MNSLLFPSWCGYFCCFLMSQTLLMELRDDCMPEKDFFPNAHQFCEFFFIIIIIIFLRKIDLKLSQRCLQKERHLSRVLHVTYFNILSRVTTSWTCWHTVNSEKVQDRNLHTGALSKGLKFKKLCFFSTGLSDKRKVALKP